MLIKILVYGSIFALIVLFIYALVHKEEEPKEELRYPALKKGVFFFAHECGDIIWKVKNKPRKVGLIEKNEYKNPTLQTLAKEHVSKTPLNTDIRITNYAWDLVDELQLAKLLDPDWEPMAAFHFLNGIVMVRYMEKPKENEDYKGSHKDLYFDTSDGHLIHWEDPKPK